MRAYILVMCVYVCECVCDIHKYTCLILCAQVPKVHRHACDSRRLLSHPGAGDGDQLWVLLQLRVADHLPGRVVQWVESGV
jgi:hypothetical protein